MNVGRNETLEKLLQMPSQLFTVEELKYLIELRVPYPLGFEKYVDRIYNRVMALVGVNNGRNQKGAD